MSIVHVTTLFSGVLRRYISKKTEYPQKMLSKYQWKSEESGILEVSGHRETTVRSLGHGAASRQSVAAGRAFPGLSSRKASDRGTHQ